MPAPQLAFARFASTDDFAAGTLAGIQLAPGGDAITLARGGSGTWTGPWVSPGFPFERVVASWNADAPAGSLLEVGIQGATSGGVVTAWYVLALWSYDDTDFRRTSVGGQADLDGDVAVDTFIAAAPLDTYRLRLKLSAHGERPTVRMLGAIASAGVGRAASASASGLATAVELAVPPYSQQIHTGEYPEFDGGGEAWCSPTATAMVLAFWGVGPTPADLEWVDPDYDDPCVDHAARFTFDSGYGGAGNWAFNVAYAARYGLDAFVTRLRSVREAEAFLEAGVPLIASIAAEPGALRGFPLPNGTAGHLVVIVGVARNGDPVVNDPAAESNAAVRRVYDRDEFERVWLEGGGGIVYVIAPPDVALPPSVGNW